MQHVAATTQSSAPITRLVSLRIHPTLAGEQVDGPDERAMLERLGTDVEDAIEELRAVAHGT
jgi:hypothetical protein